MNPRTEDREIEDRLRRTFQAVASSTKVHDDLLDEPAEIISLDVQRARRRPYWVLGVAAALALAAGTTAVLVSRDTTETTTTVPPATESAVTTPAPVTTPVLPPDPAASVPEPGRHAVLGTVSPLVWLETEENEPLADMTIRVERWVDGDREVTVVYGGDNLLNLPCDDVCSVGGPTAVYQRGLTQAEVDAIAADPSTLAAGPFELASESPLWPETASSASIWGERENEETGPGAHVAIISFPGVALDFDALEFLPVEKGLEIGGWPALYVTGLFPSDDADALRPEELDGRDAIIWSPTDEVTVAILVEGFDRDQLLAFANDVVLIGDSAWSGLVANPTGRDQYDPLGDQGRTVAVSEAGGWELVSYHGGGLDTGVSVCYEMIAQDASWLNCGPLRIAIAPQGDQAVVSGDASTVTNASSVRIVTSDGQAIDAHLTDGPYGGRIFAEVVAQELGPVTIEWLDSDGNVVDSETFAIDQSLVGG